MSKRHHKSYRSSESRALAIRTRKQLRRGEHGMNPSKRWTPNAPIREWANQETRPPDADSPQI